MSLTPNSSASAYATPADMELRYDSRLLGDLVSDVNAPVDPATLLTNPVLLTMLSAASGRVESACVAGERYLPGDLAALAGVSADFLKTLVCDLAFGMLRQRRGLPIDEGVTQVKTAMETLEQLHGGAAIFSFAETEGAGLSKTSFFDEYDFARLNLISNVCQRSLGLRTDRLPRY